MRPRRVRVKGYVRGVVPDTLQVVGGHYSLTVLLADGTASLPATLAPDLLRLLIGLPPDRFQLMQLTAGGRAGLKAVLASLPTRLHRVRGVLWLEDWHTPLPRLVRHTAPTPDLAWQLRLDL